MAEFHIPDEVEVRGMMGLLFEGLTVEPGTPVSGEGAGNIAGTYIDSDDKLAAICVCDIEFASYAGSSLTMLPKGVAEDIVLSKEPTEPLLDNLAEVLNIISRLFIRENTPHLRYDQRYMHNDMTDEIRELIASSPGRVDLKMNIPNYGMGNISLISR